MPPSATGMPGLRPSSSAAVRVSSPARSPIGSTVVGHLSLISLKLSASSRLSGQPPAGAA